MGDLSFRLEEVYVFQSTGGRGLCERLMVIVGCSCEGPSCTFTSCCTGGPGGFRKLPGLWATTMGPRESRKKKSSIPVYETHCSTLSNSPCSLYSGSPSFYKGTQGTQSGQRAHQDLPKAMWHCRSATFIQIVCFFKVT